MNDSAIITSLELYVMVGDRWEFNRRFSLDKMEVALAEASRLEQEPGIRSVRIIKEAYDPEKGISNDTVIYKTSKTKAAPSVTSRKRSGVARQPARQTGKRPRQVSRPAKAAGPSNAGIYFKLAFLVILSFATAVGATLLGSRYLPGAPIIGTSLAGDALTNTLFGVFVVTIIGAAIVYSMLFISQSELDSLPGFLESRPPPPRQPNRAAPPRAPQPVVDAATDHSDDGDSETAEQSQVEEPAEEPVEEPVEEPIKKDNRLSSLMDFIERFLRPGGDDQQDDATITGENDGAGEDLRIHQNFLLSFLSISLRNLDSEKRKILDNYNKFGINLFLAGAYEAMSTERDLEQSDTVIILGSAVQVMGFVEQQAIIFAEKYESYLLDDPRYMHIFQTGRNAMNIYLSGDIEAGGKQLDIALEAWNKPKEAAEPKGPITVMFTDIVGSTDMTQTLGDEAAQRIVRVHNRIVRESLTSFRGKEIKHTGDGIMASFSATSDSIDAAIIIQRETKNHVAANPDQPLSIRIGIDAGEPIEENDDLFGTTVQLAARVCDKAEGGETMVSNTVQGICAGRNIKFINRGPFDLKGFRDAVTIYEVDWEAQPDNPDDNDVSETEAQTETDLAATEPEENAEDRSGESFSPETIDQPEHISPSALQPDPDAPQTEPPERTDV